MKKKEENYNLTNFVRIVISITILLLTHYITGELYSVPMFASYSSLLLSTAWFILENRKIIYTPKKPYSSLIPTAFDILFISFFVYLTGSTNSILVVGYYYIILASSSNTRAPQGEFAVVLSSAVFWTMSILSYTKIIPAINIIGGITEITRFSLFTLTIVNSIVFIVINRVTKHQFKQNISLILQLEKSEKQLISRNETIELLLKDFEKQSKDWLIELDEKMIITYLPAKITSKSTHPQIGESINNIFEQNVHADDEEGSLLLKSLKDALEEGQEFRKKELKITIENKIIWFEISAYPLKFLKDYNGGWRGFGKDITEQKKLELEIRKRAYFDENTQLPNRYSLNRDLDELLGDKIDVNELSGVFGFIKIKNLDEIRINNSSLFLKEVVNSFVKRFREILTEDFSLYRLEYNEFGFWVGDQSIEHIENIHKFNRKMREPLEVDTEYIFMEIRIGIAFYPDDGKNRKSLFKAADLALNSSESLSNVTIIRYSEEYSKMFLLKTKLIRDLPKALEREDFTIFYQPQVYSEDSSLKGAEALIRWKHEKLGMISPADFIPLAEQRGFINQLGEWILYKSCMDAASWPQEITVSVNISGVQLRDPRKLTFVVKDALEKSGLKPSRLVLEFTESIILSNKDELIDFISEMKDLNINIALDDFGTGYSSLSLLQELPFDELKIDQSFVSKIGNIDSEKFIITIAELAKNLKMFIVAEGIETVEQSRFLKKLKCQVFQGYLYGKPLPVDEFQTLFLDKLKV